MNGAFDGPQHNDTIYQYTFCHSDGIWWNYSRCSSEEKNSV